MGNRPSRSRQRRNEAQQQGRQQGQAPPAGAHSPPPPGMQYPGMMIHGGGVRYPGMMLNMPVRMLSMDGRVQLFMVNPQQRQQQAPITPAPMVEEAKTIKNKANLNSRQPVKVVCRGGTSYEVHFVVDTTASVEVEVHVMERAELGPNGLTFTPRLPEPAKVDPCTTGEGHSQEIVARFTLPSRPDELLTMDITKDYYPLVIAFRYDGESGQPQYQYNYFDLAPLGKDAKEASLTLVKQMLFAEGSLFLLEQLFGTDDEGAVTGTVLEEDESSASTCVICMTNEKDITVMPCRHMCLCAECAESLRTSSNKCPICRTVIENLLHIKPSTSPPPPGVSSSSSSAIAEAT